MSGAFSRESLRCESPFDCGGLSAAFRGDLLSAVRCGARWWSASGPALSVRRARHWALNSGSGGHRRVCWPPCGAAEYETRTIQPGIAIPGIVTISLRRSYCRDAGRLHSGASRVLARLRPDWCQAKAYCTSWISAGRIVRCCTVTYPCGLTPAWFPDEPIMTDQESLTQAPKGPAVVRSCWMCGIRAPAEHMVADGGSACADVRWYCLDTRGCTQRWTSLRARPADIWRGAVGTPKTRARN
jgi:hypothetical protein